MFWPFIFVGMAVGLLLPTQAFTKLYRFAEAN